MTSEEKKILIAKNRAEAEEARLDMIRFRAEKGAKIDAEAEHKIGFTPLKGSEKQIAWAKQIRGDLLVKTNNHLFDRLIEIHGENEPVRQFDIYCSASAWPTENNVRIKSGEIEYRECNAGNSAEYVERLKKEIVSLNNLMAATLNVTDAKTFIDNRNNMSMITETIDLLASK